VSSARTSQDILTEMTTTYSKVEYMKTEYEKLELSELLGDTQKTKGVIEYSKGRIRIEETSEAKNIFIKNKKHFWHLQSENQVLTGSVENAVPTIFELMFADPKVWNELKSNIVGQTGDDVEIKILVNGKIPNVKSLNVTLNTKKRRFESLSFTDDIGNKTQMDFTNTRFFRTAPEERFNYKITKKDKVNRL